MVNGLWIFDGNVHGRYREARLFELSSFKGEAKQTLADRVEQDWKKSDPELVTAGQQGK